MPEATTSIRLLSDVGRVRYLRAARNLTWIRGFARTELMKMAATWEQAPPDVTVIIGIRNRSDYRLINSLLSLDNQAHPTGNVVPLVVDYGSDPDQASKAREICEELGASLVQVEAPGPWSRGRCLNIGLRSVNTKYVATSDVDMVFSPSYFADAVGELAKAPLSIVCAPMRDLPESALPEIKEAAADRRPLDTDAWGQPSIERFDGALHPSLGTGPTAFYQLIRGYDEHFETWGGEDRDLMKRLTTLGLDMVPQRDRSFYLHQWHPKYEGVRDEATEELVRSNRAYFRSNHTIIRNDDDWGTNTR